MDAIANDIFATKGIEYLLAIGYLMLLVPFWLLLSRPRRQAAPVPAPARAARTYGWFQLPDGVHLHRGHGWAVADGPDVVRVGMDDFAVKLVGEATALTLPPVGAHVEIGEHGWTLHEGADAVPMLSPVRGEVVAVNDAAATAPGIVNRDPYGEGWLLKVRVPQVRHALSNLLSPAMARHWMAGLTADLRARLAPELGMVLQDGGVPVAGFARELDREHWRELACAMLLSDDAPQ